MLWSRVTRLTTVVDLGAGEEEKAEMLEMTGRCEVGVEAAQLVLTTDLLAVPLPGHPHLAGDDVVVLDHALVLLAAEAGGRAADAVLAGNDLVGGGEESAEVGVEREPVRRPGEAGAGGRGEADGLAVLGGRDVVLRREDVVAGPGCLVEKTTAS